MKPVVTAQEMTQAEQTAFARGLSPREAMARAGKALFERAKSFRRVLAVCGCGNNGGDGFVCAALLAQSGMAADVWIVGDPARLSDHARFFYEKIAPQIVQTPRGPYDCIVDALFGIGFHGRLEGDYAQAAAWIARQSVFVLSADVPSGLNATTGDAENAVRADETVTFAARKRGMILSPDVCGAVTVADIGIPAASETQWIEKDDVRALVPPQKQTVHKGSRGFVGVIAGSRSATEHPVAQCGACDETQTAYPEETHGKIGVIAGSRGMEGAGALCALAALRSSAGRVSLSVPEACLPFYDGRAPEVMVAPRTELSSFLSGKDVLTLGPGLGRDEAACTLVHNVLTQAAVPLILDADALFALTDEDVAALTVPALLTPHIGEAARLFGAPASDLVRDPVTPAVAFARKTGAFILLKSHFNLLATPDEAVFSAWGCPGMATAGSGDVLAGLCAGAFCLTGNLRDAALLASFLHGTAGRIAQKEKTAYAMTAGDIAAAVPAAFRDLIEE